MSQARNRREQTGVTLVETLIALAIMGLTAASTIALIGQNTQFMFSAEERLMASIAADNIMVETLSAENLEAGEEAGDVTLSGRIFAYTRSIEISPFDGLLIVEIDVVRPPSSQVLASATTLTPVRE